MSIFPIHTKTAARYLDVPHDFVANRNALEESHDSSWFMQYGARSHRTVEIFDFLQEHFDDRVIALHFMNHTGIGIDWSPYSPDLNPCDFFLWEHLKEAVYHQKQGSYGYRYF